MILTKMCSKKNQSIAELSNYNILTQEDVEKLIKGRNFKNSSKLDAAYEHILKIVRGIVLQQKFSKYLMIYCRR